MKQAKRGIKSATKENPYHNPADNETEIYRQLKKMGIKNIPGFTLE